MLNKFSYKILILCIVFQVFTSISFAQDSLQVESMNFFNDKTTIQNSNSNAKEDISSDEVKNEKVIYQVEFATLTNPQDPNLDSELSGYIISDIPSAISVIIGAIIIGTIIFFGTQRRVR